MFHLLAQSQPGIEVIVSTVSLAITLYFWFVRANCERPNLRFFQLADFRAVTRSIPGQSGMRRLCVQQVDSSGVLVANHSTRQNAIIKYDCSFQHNGQTIKGDWGYVNDDKPPWNIGPESSIALGLAFFFDVPEDFEIPNQIRFLVVFTTVSEKQFTGDFWLKAPSFNVQHELASGSGSRRAAA